MGTQALVSMRRSIGTVWSFALPTVMLLALLLPGWASADPVLVVADQYIIQRHARTLKGGLSAQQAPYKLEKRSQHFDLVKPKSAEYRAQSNGAEYEPLNWSKVRDDCAEIRRDPTVRTCDPNVVRHLSAVPNDPDFGSQWALNDPVQGADVDLPEAWDYGTGNTGTLIGVIDSGVYAGHPDLADNFWVNPNDPIDGADNDGNGYIDDVYGANTVTGTNDNNDCNGHGTHVSGIIAARGNNGQGVSGVNWATSLIVVRTDATCNGDASVQAVVDAYDYFTTLKNLGHNIRVVNASFGGAGFIQAEYDAIARMNAAGILLVAAAGNDNRNNDTNPSYPANIDLPNVISVAATGPTRTRAAYSNYGAQSVDIMAPGGDEDYTNGGMLSTWSPLASPSALYNSIQGTSMATPMVTGALGLIASQRPTLNGAELTSLMLATASVLPGLEWVARDGKFLNVGRMATGEVPPDNCPADPNKLDPGVCGCGVADSDSNGNGRADCLDPSITDLVPTRPRVKVKGRKMFLTMQEQSGVLWYVQVQATSPRNGRSRPKTKSTYYIAEAASSVVPRPARGSSVKVRYAFVLAGSSTDFSYWSRFTRVSIP